MHAMPGRLRQGGGAARTTEWDKELLTELAQAMRDASICGLGQAAPNAFISAMQFFLDERAWEPRWPDAPREQKT